MTHKEFIFGDGILQLKKGSSDARISEVPPAIPARNPTRRKMLPLEAETSMAKSTPELGKGPSQLDMEMLAMDEIDPFAAASSAWASGDVLSSETVVKETTYQHPSEPIISPEAPAVEISKLDISEQEPLQSLVLPDPIN